MSGAKPKANSKPDGKSGGSGKGKDTFVAKAAGIVIFTGIAVSVFRALRTKKSVEEFPVAQDSNGVGASEELYSEVKKPGGFGLGLGKKFHKGNGKGKSIEIFKGDTLWSLSRKYGVSVDQIKAANGYTDDTIYAGEKIIIP